MIPLSLQLFEDATKIALIADWPEPAALTSGHGLHGFSSCEFFVPMSLKEAFRFYDMVPATWLVFGFGAGSDWEGRVEDRAIVTGGLRLTAFGAWRALMDVPYTALWSDASYDNWEVLTNEFAAVATPDRFEADKNNRLYAAPKNNETQSSSTGYLWGYRIPDDSSRNLVGISFDYELNTPSSTWNLRIDRRDKDYTFQSTVATYTGVSSGTVNLTFSGSEAVVLLFHYNSGTPVTYSGDTGAYYLKITNLRIVTSTANRVNTTTSTTISAGSQTVTPASLDGIYIGQRLFIDESQATSESVIVTDIDEGAGTFDATFVNGYSGTTTIHAHVIYADEIIKDLINHVTAVNSDQLNSSTDLIESPEVDLLDEVYEDTFPADIAIKLATLGDNQSPPQIWEVGVWERQKLHFRPQSSVAQEWFIDADTIEVDSTMETLINSAYGIYKDANGRILRTAVADDGDSQAKYGIVRRAAVNVNTTGASQAEVYRDTVIADGATIKPRSIVLPDYVMDAAGAVYPKWIIRAGDTLTMRNLPPVLSEEVDRIRSFRIAERKYDWIAGTIEVVPEEPPASLDFLIARQAEGLA
jgi:hypothetical protein